MNITPLSPEGSKGLTALKQGSYDEAYRYLSVAMTQEPVDNSILFGMAFLTRQRSEYKACLAAIDQYLKSVPQDINANIIKADALTGLKKHKTAAGFYSAAVNLAKTLKNLQPHQAKEVERAKQAFMNAQKRFTDSMQNCIESIALKDEKYTRRIDQAIDILLGKKGVFLQNPTKFYFPELPQIQFYDVEIFEWAKNIKENIDVIKDELTQLLSHSGTFKPYISHNPIAPTIDETGLNESESWTSFHLVQSGKEIPENIALCPKTYELLATAPIAKIPGKSPNILFSKLAPGAHIPPHHGEINVRLLCHLPLIVPQGCQLRVGNETQTVKEGEWMVFDDSIEHEAINQSTQQRIVLIFDIWRPELSEVEKELLCSIFQQVNQME